MITIPRPAAHRTEACRPVDDPERGSLTLFTVVFALALLAMAGLVVDGGLKLTAQRRADNQAEQAARAGAQAVNMSVLRAGGTGINAETARTAALSYLTAAGYSHGTVTVQGSGITVTVTATEPTAILRILGVSTFTLHGTGRATLLRGVTRPGQ